MHYLKYITILIFTTMAIFTKANAQELIETVKQQSDDEIIIPYSKYKLDNGLTIIVHEDHSDPIVHVDVTYHVGSAREVVGRSGFAHFFEHMMFQGSEHVADEEHFKIITNAGGTLNGTTNSDRTNYFETVPSNQLEIMLWLEADRMGWLLNAVTQKKFEIQRATVKNERGQRYDNRPYGLVTEKIKEVLYPFGHPYSWTTIGYIKDLNSATLQDLKNFFLRWYGPNNATITIAGDVNTETTVELVKQYFGSIPRGPKVKDMPAMVPTLEKTKYISYKDNINIPLLEMVYPSVPRFHPDEAPLDVLSNILGGGKGSMLYDAMEKTGFALQTFCSNPCQELSGEFTIGVLPYPGKSLAETEQKVLAVFDKFAQTGATQKDIDKFLGEYIANQINSLQRVSGKASKLASYQTFQGNANLIQKDLERYRNVTPEDVMRVFNTYIKGKHYVALSVLPKSKDVAPAQPDNAKKPSVPADYSPDLTEYNTLTYKKGKDNFDRSVKPSPGPNPVVTVPNYWQKAYENGIEAIYTKYEELPITGIRIEFQIGAMRENLDNLGIASLLENMLMESTQNYSGAEIADKLDILGSSIRINSTSDGLVVFVTCLSKNYDSTMQTMEEILLRPAFNEEDFARIKKQQLENIDNIKTNANQIANLVFNKVTYSKNSSMAYSNLGTKETIKNITAGDVKNFYTTYLSPYQAKVVIVSSLDRTDVLKGIKFLTNMPMKKIPPLQFVDAPMPDKTTIYFVDKPGAAQSVIRSGYPSLKNDLYGNQYKASLVNYALGGAFNSRLNLTLREKKGYTYGVRSGFVGNKYYGEFMVMGSFLKSATDSTIIIIMDKLKQYKNSGITPEELVFTKNSIGQRNARKYESLYQKSGFLSQILEFDADKSFVEKQQEILHNLNTMEARQISKNTIKPQNMNIVVVGDKKTVFDKVKALGYPVVELNYMGETLN